MELADFNRYAPSALDHIIKSVPHNRKFRFNQEQQNVVSEILGRGICKDIIAKELEVRTFQVNSDKLYNLVQNQPFDHIVQDSTTCLIEAGTNTKNTDPETFDSWFGKLKFIAGGANGRVFSTDRQPQIFAIKNSHTFGDGDENKEENDALEYEAFVGFAINSLRNIVPNFVHTYGIVSCPGQESQHPSICTIMGKSKNNLIIEYVNNRKNLFDASLTYEDRVCIILQLLNALKVANDEIGFVHYDLHDDNVILTELSEEIYIPLYLPNGDTKYMRTKYLLKIIDYGLARIELHNTVFHKFDFEDAGITPDNNQLYDIYKFLRYWNRRYHFNDDLIHKAFIALCLPEQFTLEINPMDPFGIYAIFNRYVKDTPTAIEFDDYFQSLYDELHSDVTFISDDYPENGIVTVCTDCYDWHDYIDKVFDNEKLPSNLLEISAVFNSLEDVEETEHINNIKGFIIDAPVDLYYDFEIMIVELRLEEVYNFLRQVITKVQALNSKEDATEDEYVELMKKIVINFQALKEINLWKEAVDYLLYQPEIVRRYFTQQYVTLQHQRLDTIDTMFPLVSVIDELKKKLNIYRSFVDEPRYYQLRDQIQNFNILGWGI